MIFHLTNCSQTIIPAEKMKLHNVFFLFFVLSLSPLTESPAFMPALPHSHKHYALTCEKEQAR